MDLLYMRYSGFTDIALLIITQFRSDLEFNLDIASAFRIAQSLPRTIGCVISRRKMKFWNVDKVFTL